MAGGMGVNRKILLVGILFSFLVFFLFLFFVFFGESELSRLKKTWQEKGLGTDNLQLKSRELLELSERELIELRNKIVRFKEGAREEKTRAFARTQHSLIDSIVLAKKIRSLNKRLESFQGSPCEKSSLMNEFAESQEKYLFSLGEYYDSLNEFQDAFPIAAKELSLKKIEVNLVARIEKLQRYRELVIALEGYC